MACNFSQLRRRQSSGSLNKGKTDDDFKDQFYRSVSAPPSLTEIILPMLETAEQVTQYWKV